MKEQKLGFKFFLLACVLMPFVLVAQHPYEKWDTGSDEHIYKEIATHRIVDQDLKNLIVEYDEMHSQFISDSLMGITVYCHISDCLITYSVNYTFGLGSKLPVLLCEPINGREVHIAFLDNLHKQIELPLQRSVELLKNSNREEYESYVAEQKESSRKNSVFVRSWTNDLVSWEIVFNKRTGECLRKHTP